MNPGLQALDGGDEFMLRSGAVPVERGQYPMLEGIVAEISARASIPQPTVWIGFVDEPNACAAGRTPYDSAVQVTSGLLEIVTPGELRAVIAHEVGHIRLGHTSIRTQAVISELRAQGVGALALGEVAGLGALLLRKAFPLGGLVLAGTAVAASIYGRSKFREAAGFRQAHELQADAFAGSLTSGTDMMSALVKIDAEAHTELADWTRGFQFSNGSAHKYATHPPTTTRVRSLQVTRVADPSGVCRRCRAPVTTVPCGCGEEHPVAEPRSCADCGSALGPDDRYCGVCGIRQWGASCRICGHPVATDAVECIGCGFLTP